MAYFSHVRGVLSLKSSITSLPAGSSPMLTSRKTRGRAMEEVRIIGGRRFADRSSVAVDLVGQLRVGLELGVQN